MFGDITGMMQKLKEAQKKIEETKSRLNTVLVEGSANNGQIKVIMTANRAVRSIEIHDDLLNDKEIAAVLTYVRNSWGNSAPAVSPAAVTKLRKATKKQDTPWEAKELIKKYPFTKK